MRHSFVLLLIAVVGGALTLGGSAMGLASSSETQINLLSKSVLLSKLGGCADTGCEAEDCDTSSCSDDLSQQCSKVTADGVEICAKLEENDGEVCGATAEGYDCSQETAHGDCAEVFSGELVEGSCVGPSGYVCESTGDNCGDATHSCRQTSCSTSGSG